MNDRGALGRIDEVVDGAFEPLRGKAPVDRGAAAFSNLSDYGLVWVLLGLVKMRRRGPGRRRAFLALGAAGFSSLFVSRLVKRTVDRERPEDHLDASVRSPTSSSFPSGHTLAAFTTAFVLAESDVMGGAVIGSVLGMALRPVVNAITPGTVGRRRARGRPGRGAGMGGSDHVLKRL